MESIRKLAQSNLCPVDDGSAPDGARSKAVKEGSALARYLPAATAEGRGANLVEPFVPRPPPPPARRPAQGRDAPVMTAGSLAFTGKAPRTAGAPASEGARPGATHTFSRTDGTPFPTSRDGTPRYKQNDREAGGNWGATLLGEGAKALSIGLVGCAMSSVAMALSKLSGETLTPARLDAHLDTHEGYRRDAKTGLLSNSMMWAVAGTAVQPPIEVTRITQWDLGAIDASLAEGRPVVIGVDYKPGQSGGNQGTDHWVCLTSRDAEDPGLYHANDPTTGDEVWFRRQPDGTLKQVASRPDEVLTGYKSSGEYVVFEPRSRGRR
ncbi:C39 family peptidase [Myxococcaceae bacterium GXIMD 01537]